MRLYIKLPYNYIKIMKNRDETFYLCSVAWSRGVNRQKNIFVTVYIPTNNPRSPS